jgi:hypothetical protein
LASLAKKPSTALSHDADVGVKWKVHRGCRTSQGLHLRVFVGGVVINDGVDRFALWHSGLGDVEKADKLLMPVPLHAAADHRAVQNVKRREQRRRAMPLSGGSWCRSVSGLFVYGAAENLLELSGRACGLHLSMSTCGGEPDLNGDSVR